MDVLRRQAVSEQEGLDPGWRSSSEACASRSSNCASSCSVFTRLMWSPGACPISSARWPRGSSTRTGISTSFASEVETVSLSRTTCNELVRILQEALINIRKHSGADHVDIRLSTREGQYALLVADNGRGFDFAGRFPRSRWSPRAPGPS